MLAPQSHDGWFEFCDLPLQVPNLLKQLKDAHVGTSENRLRLVALTPHVLYPLVRRLFRSLLLGSLTRRAPGFLMQLDVCLDFFDEIGEAILL